MSRNIKTMIRPIGGILTGFIVFHLLAALKCIIPIDEGMVYYFAFLIGNFCTGYIVKERNILFLIVLWAMFTIELIYFWALILTMNMPFSLALKQAPIHFFRSIPIDRLFVIIVGLAGYYLGIYCAQRRNPSLS